MSSQQIVGNSGDSYNPRNVTLIIAGRIIRGFHSESYITFERNVPEELMHDVGAQGDYTIIENVDRSATLTFHLKPETPNNGFLVSLLQTRAVFDLSCVHNMGVSRENANGLDAVVKQVARYNFPGDKGATSPSREYMISIGNLVEVPEYA